MPGLVAPAHAEPSVHIENAARQLLISGWAPGPIRGAFNATQNVGARHMHDWVIVTRRGRPVILANDAFQAAQWLYALDACHVPAHPRKVTKIQSDAEIQDARWRTWWNSRGQYGWPLGHNICQRIRVAFLQTLLARS